MAQMYELSATVRAVEPPAISYHAKFLKRASVICFHQETVQVVKDHSWSLSRSQTPGLERSTRQPVKPLRLP